MGGAVIEPGTTLLPLSLVLKEMHLPTATYEGSPAEPRGARSRCLRPRSQRPIRSSCMEAWSGISLAAGAAAAT